MSELAIFWHLARLIPEHGRGIDPVTLLAHLHDARVDVDLDGLSDVLHYLVTHRQVVEDAGRYRLAGR